MQTRIVFVIFLLVSRLAVSSASATTFRSTEGDVIGRLSHHQITQGESLVEIARNFDIGFNAISAANPGLDAFIPPAGTAVLIPTAWILPNVAERKGIVVNLSEMRLYYFPGKDPNSVVTYPIGIGDEGKDTPSGHYSIIEKIRRPYWYVPDSIRKEKPELPEVVPPGPDNPLGSYALRLSLPTILIHGTDRPFGIGRRVSHGCMHLYPEDISILFKLVRDGERVIIIREPVKVGGRQDRVYVEVHNEGNEDFLRNALTKLERANLLERIDMAKLFRAIAEKKGIPVDISR